MVSSTALSTRTWKTVLLPFKCWEHLESRCHDMLNVVFFVTRRICKRSSLFLWYPHLLGSFLVSSPQVLIELGFDIISNRRNSMIISNMSFMIFPRLCRMLFSVCYVKALCM